MRKYPAENWIRLGHRVHDLRIQVGHVDTKLWAEEVGRSSRQLLGLERGEPVGPKTLERVAKALYVSPWSLYAVLIGEEAVNFTDAPDADVARVKRMYETETGLPAEENVAARQVVTARVFRRPTGRFGIEFETEGGTVVQVGRAYFTEPEAEAVARELGYEVGGPGETLTPPPD